MVAGTTSGPGGPKQTSNFDFKEILEQYKLPGVDFAALLERERKNIEALTKANMVAFEGWQTLVQKQTDILKDTMAQAVAIARNSDTAGSQSEIAKQSFEKALENMRELAQIVVKSQSDAFEVVRNRVHEYMDELRDLKK
jgi:phasin family protein